MARSYKPRNMYGEKRSTFGHRHIDGLSPGYKLVSKSPFKVYQSDKVGLFDLSDREVIAQLRSSNVRAVRAACVEIRRRTNRNRMMPLAKADWEIVHRFFPPGKRVKHKGKRSTVPMVRKVPKVFNYASGAPSGSVDGFSGYPTGW